MIGYYEELLRIKEPVLIYVAYFDPNGQGDRLRILYPSGVCKYKRTTFSPKNYTPCCYSIYGELSLAETVRRMKKFDQESKLTVTGYGKIFDEDLRKTK